MKVFVDTNVILEYVLQREQYAEAKLAIARGAELKAKLFMSVGSFYSMLFIVEKYFRKDLRQSRLDAVAQTRDVMIKVLSLFTKTRSCCVTSFGFLSKSVKVRRANRKQVGSRSRVGRG